MALIQRSDGKNGIETGTFLKLNWGVLIGIIVTVAIAAFGIINAANTTAHSSLDTKIDKVVTSVGSLERVVSTNCSDIAVLKSETTTVKGVLNKMDDKLDRIRRDQTDYQISRGFKSRVLPEVPHK